MMPCGTKNRSRQSLLSCGCTSHHPAVIFRRQLARSRQVLSISIEKASLLLPARGELGGFPQERDPGRLRRIFGIADTGMAKTEEKFLQDLH